MKELFSSCVAREDDFLACVEQAFRESDYFLTELEDARVNTSSAPERILVRGTATVEASDGKPVCHNGELYARILLTGNIKVKVES